MMTSFYVLVYSPSKTYILLVRSLANERTTFEAAGKRQISQKAHIPSSKFG